MYIQAKLCSTQTNESANQREARSLANWVTSLRLSPVLLVEGQVLEGVDWWGKFNPGLAVTRWHSCKLAVPGAFGTFVVGDVCISVGWGWQWQGVAPKLSHISHRQFCFCCQHQLQTLSQQQKCHFFLKPWSRFLIRIQMWIWDVDYTEVSIFPMKTPEMSFFWNLGQSSMFPIWIWM